MSKSNYRLFFAQCKHLLRMVKFCEKANVNPVCFSRFMKGEEFNYYLSLEKLQDLYNVVIDELSSLIA